MKKRILKIILVIVLITSLAMLNVIMLGHSIVIAIAEGLENQGMETNVKNVEYDIYLKENKAHQKVGLIGQEEILILNVKVKDKGSFHDGKITLSNANMTFAKDKIQNSNIKNVTNNEIELNTIIYGSDIQIEIPVMFHRQDTFDTNYFNRGNIITLNGTYKEENEQQVNEQRSVQIDWTQEADISMTQTIEKYMDLGENGILLEQAVTTQVQENKLPRETENIETILPTLGQEKAKEVYVLVNGQKMAQEKVNYDSQTGKVTIQNQADTPIWGMENNTYKIVAIYEKQAGTEIRTVSIKTTMKTKLYTKGEVVKEETKEQEIHLGGNLATIQKTSNSELYKGYLYAKTENETIFEEENKIEIARVAEIDSLQLQRQNESFNNEANALFDVSDQVIYKNTTINKNNMKQILGENGNLIIKNDQDEIVATIDQTTQSDDAGNVVISYETGIKDLKVITSKPIEEGNLIIRHTRAIQGNTPYTKEQLKTFVGLTTKSKVITNLGEEVSQTTIPLKDTKTQATIQMSNTNLSTLQTNENVQFLVTLKTNSEVYDLFQNPKVEIVLPKELSVSVKNITQLNAQDQMSITNPKLYKNENGEQVISLELNGNQTAFENSINEGIQVSITADFYSDKKTPTKSTQVVMNYTNENRKGETFQETLPIKLNSKYGMLVVNQLSNYNEDGDIFESIDDKVKIAQLDSNAGTRIAKQEISFVNNYEHPISDAYILGKIPSIEKEELNDTTLKSTFEIKLKEMIQLVGTNGKIYYSEDSNAAKDSNTWVENIEDLSKVRAYKIETENGTIEPGQVITLKYSMEIPENIKENEEGYTRTSFYYNYSGNPIEINSCIKLGTQKKIEESNNILEETEQMAIELTAKSGGERLTQGEEVKEGQGIKYALKITNKTKEDIKNLKLVASQTNSIFYDEIIHTDGWDSITDTTVNYTTIGENKELKEKIFQEEVLKAGETKTYEYQISVKEVDGNEEVTAGKIVITGENLEEKTVRTPENKILQGNLKITIANTYMEEYPVQSNSLMPVTIKVYNLSEKEEKDTIVTLKLPEELSLDSKYIVSGDLVKYDEKENIATFKVAKLEAANTSDTEEQKEAKAATIQVSLVTNKMDVLKEQEKIELFATAKLEEQTYISNEITRVIHQAGANIEAKQTGSITTDTVKDGDSLRYSLKVKNNSARERSITISDSVPLGAEIQEVYIWNKNEKKEVANLNNNMIYHYQILQPEEELELVIDTIIRQKDIVGATITNDINITTTGGLISCNKITYKVEGREMPPEQEETETKIIRGTAWIDENKNGAREEKEEKLSNLPVFLINAKDGKIAISQNGDEISTITDSSGHYEFSDILQGEYFVLFQYDAMKYRITNYQEEGISQSNNSDVIGKKINLNGTETQVAMTQTLIIEKEDRNNIDAGFIKTEKFDFKLDKYINKIILQNNKGTTVKQYDKEKLVKIELNAKNLVNTNVIVEYGIEVTNEGEVAGYANEIADYLPNDLKFSSELNKNWYQTTKGDLYNKELSNQLINPGETKIITLTLMKTMNQDNVGTIINTAELKQISNDFMVQDIDSTPNNKVQEEDDISTAEVIVSISTGSAIIFTVLILIIIGITAMGIYLINKKVLKNEE